MAQFTSPAPKVGDIFCASYGYDATFKDFYKVIKVTATTVTIVQMEEIIDASSAGPSWYVKPADTIKEGAEPIRRKFRAYGGSDFWVKISDYCFASTWGGGWEYQTAMGWY